MLDTQDQVVAQRYVQQAYFSIQKQRIRQLIAERIEFHPFWGANPLSSEEHDQNDEMDDLDE